MFEVARVLRVLNDVDVVLLNKAAVRESFLVEWRKMKRVAKSLIYAGKLCTK